MNYLLFTDKTEYNARKRTQDTKYPSTPLPPIELWPGLFFLVFLHMFLSPPWFCIKLLSMVLHVFFYSAKIGIVLLILRTIFVLQQVSCYNYLYLNNFQSQKVKPCGRTTLFSAGLQCQTHKGRQTVLDGGTGPCSMAGVYLGLTKRTMSSVNVLHQPGVEQVIDIAPNPHWVSDAVFFFLFFMWHRWRPSQEIYHEWQ